MPPSFPILYDRNQLIYVKIKSLKTTEWVLLRFDWSILGEDYEINTYLVLNWRRIYLIFIYFFALPRVVAMLRSSRGSAMRKYHFEIKYLTTLYFFLWNRRNNLETNIRSLVPEMRAYNFTHFYVLYIVDQTEARKKRVASTPSDTYGGRTGRW